MPTQAMKPQRPEMLTIHVYAVPSPIKLVRNANKPIAVVNINAGTGTPRLLSFAKICGAWPYLASAYSIRVEEYKPELPALNTAVKMIALIKLAANANPKRSNTSVNGEMDTFSTLEFNRFGSV